MLERNARAALVLAIFSMTSACDGNSGSPEPSLDASADAFPYSPDVTAPAVSDGGPDTSVVADGGTADADAASLVSPSCVGLAKVCGATGDGDCCASSVVPGGTFKRANDDAAAATVSAFQLDVYEVTVGRFQTFIDKGWATKIDAPPAGSGAHPSASGTGWRAEWNVELPKDRAAAAKELDNPSSTFVAGNPTRPVNFVTWYQAFAFCAWDGGRLPTLAESSFAATGGNEQRYYPWSAPPSNMTIDATYASYKEDGPRYCNGDGIDGCEVTDLIPVGTRPKGNGRWGHADLAGNVTEWVMDGASTLSVPCADCVAPWATARATHSAAYTDGAYAQRNEVRGDMFAGDAKSWLGFRCARALPR